MFQFGDYNLGLFIWPFENDFVFVKPPKDNLPLLNDCIGVIHLLNFHPGPRTRLWFDPPEGEGKVPWNSEGASPAVAADHQR